VELELSPACRWCGGGPLSDRLEFPADLAAAAPPAPPSARLAAAAAVAVVSGRAGGPGVAGGADPPRLWRLQRCGACGAWQVNPHPGREAAKKFFQSPERWLTGRDPGRALVSPVERAETRRREYAVYAAAMSRLMPGHGAVLDVGAGTGLMLSLLDVPNPKLAVEPNPMAARLAARRGLDVVGIWAEDLGPPKAPLAAVIFNQSLDHLARPDLLLMKAASWLAPGGLLLLGNLINPGSLAARIYGPDHRLFHPLHQVYPTPAAVRFVLEPLGFELVSSWRPYLGTPYGSWPLLAKSTASLALKLLKIASGPSPAYPGSTVTYLARKNLLFRFVKAPERASLPC
jgi:SAM-dependent methyltransferase